MAKRRYARADVKKLHELFAKRLTVAECARQLAMPESTVRDHLVRWHSRPEVATLSYTEDLDAISSMQRARQASWYVLLQRIMKGEVANRELCRLAIELENYCRSREPPGFERWLSEMLPLKVLPDELLSRLIGGEPFQIVALDLIRETAEDLVEKRKREEEYARFRQLS